MTAIKFENISKQYRLGLVSTHTLSHDLNRWFQMNVRRREDPYLRIGDVNDRATKGDSDYVWALRDINLDVNQGDVVGIVGKNGAGKSTLLKILSKVTAPTTGTIKSHGRIASLLEVGTGFHPEMTGRENIYMNGAIMGMTKAEITRKLDEIVDFSGVERYIDTPTKRYSSGMTVRLGFAIAAHLDPEILVVDEVLAVGDAEFQKKAIGKMQDVSKGEGRTVLFVSHNMASLRSLCTQGVLMDKGMIVSSGQIGTICDMYLKGSSDKEISGFWKNKNILENKNFQLTELEILDNKGVLNSVFSCDDSILVRMHFNVKEKVPGIYGCMYLKKEDGTTVYMSDSNDYKYNSLENLPIGISVVDVVIPHRHLGVGNYVLSLYFTSNFNPGGFYVDTQEDVCKFEIYDDTTNRGNNRAGFLSTVIEWKIE